MSKPQKPSAPGAEKSTIQVESNDAVQASGPAPVESVVDDTHPQGIVIETFVGLQRNVQWADAATEAPAAE